MINDHPRFRRSAMVLAGSIMVLLPLAAFELAPAAQADNSPGANLAGINATATATGMELAPLTPGVVGAGNVSQGNLISAAVPYATANTTTGPSNSATSSPAYPGPTAAQAGTDIETFSSQFPTALANALNYPAQAQADYPPQLTIGSSSSYAPPGGSATGVGTASANATDSGAQSNSSSSAEGFGTLMSISSSTSSAKTVLEASSVASTAHTDVGTIKLLGGAVTISNVTSEATATSDGTTGKPSTTFKIGSVTVAGKAAYIGPDGIHLASTTQGSLLTPTANTVLADLAQAGIQAKTISPQSTTNGGSATVTSGALEIQFLQQHIPNAGGRVPVSAIGLDVYVGLSQADANATALPPFTPVGAIGGTGAATGGSATSGSSSAPVASLGGASASVFPSPPLPASSSSTLSQQGSGGSGSATAPQPATLLGLPVKVSWVIIAILLSIVASGPLLGYANWQLLRGRRT
jgi:hypothetical protein